MVTRAKANFEKASAQPLNLVHEMRMRQTIQGPIAGLDEAGRGPLAGPVVAAAVILDEQRLPDGLQDSKALSRDRRDELFQTLQLSATIGVGIVGVEKIDALNILQATMLAMREAYDNLSLPPAGALVDGNQAPSLDCPVETIVKGDAQCFSIAAASIIAKVTRDRIMRALAEMHPAYGWENNKGYGTQEHKQALKRFGATPHHRRSFAPVRAVLQQQPW